MIQVNLLPDIKLEYLRAKQTKHMVVVGSVLSTLAALSVLVLLFSYVQIVQPRHRANLQKDIDSGIEEVKSKDNAVKITTVQGVLEQIPKLQDGKPATSSLFTYLTSFTPRDVSYSEVKLDIAAGTLTLSGQTTTLEQANVLANNLKSAKFTYSQNDSQQTIQPFKDVVFASLGKSDSSQGTKPVAFQLGLAFDPVLFSQGLKDPKISVNASSENLLLPSAQPFSDNASSGGRR